MGDRKVTIAAGLGLVLGLLVGGVVTFYFFRPAPPGVPTPHPREASAFLSACRDIDAIVERSLPAKDVILESKIGKLSPTGSRVQRIEYDRLHSFMNGACDVSATEDGIAKLIDGLHAEIKKAAQQTEVIVDFETKGGVALPPYSYVRSIEYTAGKAFGTVLVTVGGKGVRLGFYSHW
jgi:hypothetical protein